MSKNDTTPMLDVTPLTASKPVNQQIYRRLRKAIVTCEILPGSSLSEKEISTLFAVSRQPVREAFIKLAEAGLVQILPQRGTFVTKISAKKVIDGQFIREAVECAVISRVAQQISDAELARLQQNIIEQRTAIAEQNDVLFLAKDDEFHQILMEVIDCSLAWQTVENIKAMMDRVRFLTLESVTPPELLLAQHEKIFAALNQRDSEQAITALQSHLRAILDSKNVIVAQNSAWFTD